MTEIGNYTIKFKSINEKQKNVLQENRDMVLVVEEL